MSKKHRLSLITFFAALVCLVYFATFGIRTTRVKTLQQVVRKNIKTGESPPEVIHFLRDQNLEPSDLIQPAVMKINGHDYAGQSIVVAVKRYSSKALLWKEMIYLVFVFDRDGRLTRYDVFPVYESF